MTEQVPAIDIDPFLSGTAADKLAVAAAVRKACEEIGFLIVSGHGLPVETTEDLVTRSFAFFDQPNAAKARWSPTGAARQRGYHGVATRSLSATLGNDAPKDLRESLFLGPVDDHAHAYAHIPDATAAYAPNLLPDQPEGMDHALIAMYRGFERLAADMLRIFAVALDMPEDHFAPLIDRHFSIMSVHHYPALQAPPEPGQLRTGEHTDYGALTILATTQARGGLEARRADGQWIKVQPAPGELVVNLGDMMQRWTNDAWVSTLHRVALPDRLDDTASRRLSVGYFMHPNYDAEIACIPSCVASGELPKFGPITAGGHIRAKIDASHNS